MALTEFQRNILRFLAPSRLERESYIAGGAALNTQLYAPRRSRDIDLFHDTIEAVARTVEADRILLEGRGRYSLGLDRPAHPPRCKIPRPDARYRMPDAGHRTSVTGTVTGSGWGSVTATDTGTGTDTDRAQKGSAETDAQ